MMTEKEFNHIVLPLAQNIWSYALNLTGNRTISADLTQEVMLRLWDSRQQLSRVGNIKAWALKITHNLWLDWLKKQKPIYDEAELLKNGGHETDLLQQIAQKETAEAVRKIIDTLPPNQREVIILREIEELEYEEIAKITGLGLNNIRVLLSRARNKVKEILVKQYHISLYEN